MTPTNVNAQPAVTIRALAPGDLDAVVAIDAATEGRTRREYIERRLSAARREPALHAQFAAEDGQGLAGFILARVLAGEFGRRQPTLRLELVGVRADRRGAGVGSALFETLCGWARRHGVGEVRTTATWRATQMLGWFAGQGFELARDQVVDCAVGACAWRGRDEPIAIEAGSGPGHEIDYGRPEANDQERIARDGAVVRSMAQADLDSIARIDRGITGRDRRDYIAARLAEALDDGGVRVSLTARRDDTIVGYLMARADFGDYGRTEPVAVIDTLGVDPEYADQGVGRALLAELFAQLGALGVERVETIVPQYDLSLLGFLYAGGFAPSPRLVFAKTLETAA